MTEPAFVYQTDIATTPRAALATLTAGGLNRPILANLQAFTEKDG